MYWSSFWHRLEMNGWVDSRIYVSTKQRNYEWLKFSTVLCAYLMYNNVTETLCFLCLSMLRYGFNAFFFNGLGALLTLVVQ